MSALLVLAVALLLIVTVVAVKAVTVVPAGMPGPWTFQPTASPEVVESPVIVFEPLVMLPVALNERPMFGMKFAIDVALTSPRAVGFGTATLSLTSVQPVLAVALTGT